jgi:hypothetical protein
MTPEEKFKFDLEGYLVVKQVLDADEVDMLNRLTDQVFPGEYNEKGMWMTRWVSKWGPPTLALIDHPRVLPYLIGLMGMYFRIDHDYCILMRKGGKGGGLHGGPRLQWGDGMPGDHWYECQNGVIRNGLTVFTYCLSPARAGDGGFACVPGSHKTNLLADLPDDVRTFERSAHYVVQPEVEAGDMIIFTEALIHGTMPWTADHNRRGILFKYSPGHSSYSNETYNPEDYPDVTDQQRRIMAPPSIRDREVSVTNV